MEFLRMDLFLGEIFVFTPKGEVKQLPVGATPIDFAFAVHTEVGFHCAGAQGERADRPPLPGAPRTGTRWRSSPPRSRLPSPGTGWPS
jgi:GTP diphosphokinase / guanosine-3',5'-bis(diphosphate) 3'-diphosphatase